MKVIFLRQAHHFIRRADKLLKNKIRFEVCKIQDDPFSAEPLTGNLKGIYSHHFSFKGSQYRIAYQITENVIIITIATRENFYRDLSR